MLATIKSNQLIRGMDAFVEASKRFGEITGSLDQFERARRLMLIAAQETINLQKISMNLCRYQSKLQQKSTQFLTELLSLRQILMDLVRT